VRAVQLASAVMCAKYISTLPDHGAGLGAYIPFFREFAEDLQSVTRASELTWLHLVTEAERPAFEAAAAQAAARLDTQDGDASGALAAAAREFGIRAVPPADAAAGEKALAGAPPRRFARAPAAALHAAVWAGAPRNATAAYFLYNALSDPVRRDALARVLDTSAPAATEPALFTFADAPGRSGGAPAAVIYAPAWPHLRANRTYGVGASAADAEAFAVSGSAGAGRAVCGVAFHWEAALRNALPSFVTSIVAVLRSPRGEEFTFQIRGADVATVGRGGGAGLARGFAHLGQRARVEVAGAAWSVTLFPTDEARARAMRKCIALFLRTQNVTHALTHSRTRSLAPSRAQLRRRYVTRAPRDYALGVAAAGAACALLFVRCCLWFEFFDRARMRRVHARLLAYIADLERMQRQLAAGHARESQAAAKALAEEASSRQKDAFVAMVSHEIRTPLNAVSGAAALLARTPLDGEQAELVSLLEAGTAHVVLIVEDILIAGALASGSFAVARERLALAAAVVEPAWRMVAMQRGQQAKLRALRLSRDVAGGVPGMIVGDSTRLTQVLTNILSNSVKFTPEGGAIHLHVDVTGEAPVRWAPADAADAAAQKQQQQQQQQQQTVAQRWLRFRVTDTGIGIAAGALARVYACVRVCTLVLTAPPAAFCKCPFGSNYAQRTWSAFFSRLCKRSSPPCASTAAPGWASRRVLHARQQAAACVISFALDG
jgi:signal transduction histidine kinase